MKNYAPDDLKYINKMKGLLADAMQGAKNGHYLALQSYFADVTKGCSPKEAADSYDDVVWWENAIEEVKEKTSEFYASDVFRN